VGKKGVFGKDAIATYSPGIDLVKTSDQFFHKFRNLNSNSESELRSTKHESPHPHYRGAAHAKVLGSGMVRSGIDTDAIKAQSSNSRFRGVPTYQKTAIFLETREGNVHSFNESARRWSLHEAKV